MLDKLKFYVGLGMRIFPCSNRDKTPLTPHGFKDATTDVALIEKWYALYPDCAWGTATSAGYGVVDVDPQHGGWETWDALIEQHGLIPHTPAVRTGGCGWHYVFRFPPGTRSGTNKFGKGIDLKAEGGYVILPPSRVFQPHHNGPYRWTVPPWDADPAPAPEWLVALARRSETPSTAILTPDAGPAQILHGGENSGPADIGDGDIGDGDIQTHPGSPEGERRVTLCKLAGAALGRGFAPSEVRAWAEAWAGRCSPPFEEWRKHADGLVKRETEKLNNSSHLPPVTVPVLPSADTGRKELNQPPPASVKGELFPSLTLSGTVSGPSVRHELFPSLTPPATTLGPVPDSFPSFHPSGELVDGDGDGGEGGGVFDVVEHVPSGLHPDAYHGLFGEMLRAVEPETEAHPAGVLVSFLTMFGNAVGRGAWVKVGPRNHHPAVYTAIACRTSGGKGDAYAVARYAFGKADPGYCRDSVANGVGSGEGLVERVRDDLSTVDKKGEPILIPGATEKRCLLRLSELSRAFKAGRRESSTLSEMLREGWDGDPIHVPNRGGAALSASEYSVGVLGDITPGALGKLLSTGTESVDGYANRFLWCSVHSVRDLPEGGDIRVLDPFAGPLRDALQAARKAGEVTRDAGAKALWASVYPSLKASGDTVPHTDRARPYVVRLSLIYALADGERVVREPHLRAALAVWDYCRRSAAGLFGKGAGNPSPPEPDPLWLVLLNAITAAPGVGRSELLRATREPADAVGEALTKLEKSGRAHPVRASTPGRGPKAEGWFPGPGNGEELNNTLSPSPFTDPDSPASERVPPPRAAGEGREGINSGLTVAGGITPSGTGKEGNESPSGGGDPVSIPSFRVSGDGRQVKGDSVVEQTPTPVPPDPRDVLTDAEVAEFFAAM